MTSDRLHPTGPSSGHSDRYPTTGRCLDWNISGLCEQTQVKMKYAKVLLLWCCVALPAVFCLEVDESYHQENVQIDSESSRDRRDVIEEEKYYNIHTDNRKDYQQKESHVHQPWVPNPLPPEDPTTKISITNNNELKDDVSPLFQTTERVTDKPTGRGARASNDNWIKLPYPNREDIQRGHDDRRDDILTPPQPSGELINSRMPRINFVTQNKHLETSESRNDKESIRRASRKDEIRTEFVRPDEDERSKLYKPVFPRQAIYYPEESRRTFNEDRYYPIDDMYRRDPYYDTYDRRRYNPYYAPRTDRFDDHYDNLIPRKPKRIIYYAHLPEVVRTPPSVDLRYRYSVDPYRRPEEDYFARTGRYDYRFRNRYPYAPFRKEERNYRDLTGSGTTAKDKKIEEKVTPTPVIPKKDDKFQNNNANVSPSRNLINSHQYHDSIDLTYNDAVAHKGFQDGRPDDAYLRYDEPLFQGTVEDPYQRKY